MGFQPATMQRYADMLNEWSAEIARARADYQRHPSAFHNRHDPECVKQWCENTAGKRGKFCWKHRNERRWARP